LQPTELGTRTLREESPYLVCGFEVSQVASNGSEPNNVVCESTRRTSTMSSMPTVGDVVVGIRILPRTSPKTVPHRRPKPHPWLWPQPIPAPNPVAPLVCCIVQPHSLRFTSTLQRIHDDPQLPTWLKSTSSAEDAH
jgi:hypothetical protein